MIRPDTDYLSTINAHPGITAAFISRIPGVTVDTDKWGTLERLKPFHDEQIRETGLAPGELWLAEQVHGADIAFVNEQDNTTPHLIGNVDGLVAPGGKRCLLGIYVADCAAVWLHDKKSGAIALLHSGKKGTEGKISQVALTAMEKHFRTNPLDVEAVISPCIHPPHYETDISSQILDQLLDAGLLPENIYDSGICTGSDTETYYSYRVEKGKTGRMLALLSIS